MLFFRDDKFNDRKLYVRELPSFGNISPEIISAVRQGKLHINLQKYDQVTEQDVQQIILELTVGSLLGDVGGISLESTAEILDSIKKPIDPKRPRKHTDGNPSRVVLWPAYTDTLTGIVWMYTDEFIKIAGAKATFIPADKLYSSWPWYNNLRFCPDCFSVHRGYEDVPNALIAKGAIDTRTDSSLEKVFKEYSHEPKDEFESWYITMKANPYQITYQRDMTIVTPNNKMEFIVRKRVDGKLVERNNEQFAAVMNRNIDSIFASKTYGRYFQLLDIINQLKPLIENLSLFNLQITSKLKKYKTYFTPTHMPVVLSNYSDTPCLSGGVAYRFTPVTTAQAQFISLPARIASLDTEQLNYQQNSYLSFNDKVTKHTFINSVEWLENSIPFKLMTRHEKGNYAEKLVQETYQARGFIQLGSKMNGNQGIDGVYYKEKSNGTIEIEINETKYNADGKFKSQSTETKGNQMSQFWVRETVSRMMGYDKDTEVKRVGNVLAQMINEEGPGFFSRRTITVVDRHKNIHWHSEEAIKEYNIDTFQHKLRRK
jgi:hypothetical protein